MVHIYYGILLSYKKRRNFAILGNTYGLWEYHAQWNKSSILELGTVWFHLYMEYKTESNKWTNKTHRHRQQHGGYQIEGVGGTEG